MAKQENIKLEGEVTEVLPQTNFRVYSEDTNGEVLCSLSGKMRVNNIKVLMGDFVEFEVSPYDLSRGRITKRV